MSTEPVVDPTALHRPAELGTILGVWAHPDDEAFLSGGIMAMATDAGSRVVCVTATRGEAGSSNPGHCPPHVLAKVRERELAECLAILGVQEHHWLGYHDGECDSVDIDEAATQIAAMIEDVQPDAILTFGPEGFTDHPDHKAISRWVVEAHRRTGGDAARQLHFATQTTAWIDQHGPLMVDIGVFPPGFPPRSGPEALSIDIELPDLLNQRKVRALRAQESQIEDLVQTIGLPTFSAAFSVERFRLATTTDEFR